MSMQRFLLFEITSLSSINKASTIQKQSEPDSLPCQPIAEKMLKHCQREQAALEAECAAIEHEVEHRPPALRAGKRLEV
ncbi:hypothetical protein [Grimontia sp. SpTr1]|uniref:hypothetical protein n=1 Tax=Grimontia sp. SpTr1 TaxID=2995319 RepID=UPI00248B9A10|nr:hypothetical protein [Grimontia sp. SpTr1]